MPGDRTEQATPHRRQKARREGDILHSRELTSAAAMLAGVSVLGLVAARAVEAWRTALGVSLSLGGAAHWEPEAVATTLAALGRASLAVLLPVALLFAAIAGAALLAGMAQTGGLEIHPGVVGFRASRLNPAENLRNLFSVRAAARLGKSLLPAVVLSLLAAQRIRGVLALPAFSLERLSGLGGEVYGLLVTAAWLMFAWSAVDYLFEWRHRESRLRMSREEMREEYKETEGSPQIRSRIRGLQRQMRQRRVRADVSRAAVVLTNPTHYAVALGFDFATMETPRVLAKGRNLLAEEIKAEARWAGVPIVENPPLARSIYRSIPVGRPIPVDLSAAVASILAFLYRQRVEDEMRRRRAAAQAAGNPVAVGPVSTGPAAARPAAAAPGSSGARP